MAQPLRPHRDGQQLFSESGFDRFLKEQTQLAVHAISDITIADGLDAAAATAVTAGSIEVPNLRRTEASFEREVVQDGNRMILTVPFDGAAIVFRYAPTGVHAQDARVSGEVIQPSHRWQVGGDETEPGPHLQFERTFADATPAVVKKWGKDVVDTVENRLGLLGEEIRQHNRSVEHSVPQLVDQRRRVLAAGGALDDLGQGI